MSKSGAQAIPTIRFKPYPVYKDSGIEWLGEIPTHWGIRRIRSTIASCQNGVWGDEPDGVNDVVCIRVADFDRVTFRVAVADPTMRSIEPGVVVARGLQVGDLLLEKSGGGENQPVGAVVLYDHTIPAVCSNFIARVTVADGYNARFLTYLHAALYALRINTRHIKQSTGIQNLDSSSYLSEATGLPPEPEQRAMAAFLDRETAKIDGLVAKKERLIELLQERRTSLVTRAVTKGLDPNVPMKNSGVEWLGEIPAHWELKSFGNIVQYISYGFTNPMPIDDNGPFMLTANDIGDGTILYESARRTTEQAYIKDLTGKSRPRKNDVLLTKDGTLGRIAVFDGRRACINQSVALLRINHEKANLDFIQNLLRAHAYQERMAFDAGGTTIKHIYISRIVKMPIAFPPSIEEQEDISTHINNVRNRIDALIAKVRGGVERLKEYRTALISAAVMGKIDVRKEVA
jgi:type I restriction enzyme S subunit